MFRLRALASAVCAAFLLIPPIRAATPRALPPGQLPADARLKPLVDLDGYFPFAPPPTAGEWDKRADLVRRRILVSLGLWPMPEKTPLNAIIHGRIDRGDYTVENVYFESLPGFFVTGNLYRPAGRTGRLPGVLCPHGHWEEGRFMDQGEAVVKREIASGAERFEEGGRSVLQARCVQLARMGCVVFHYDMIGYADSVQLSHELAHGFARQRPDMNGTDGWGLFSPRAEAHLQSVMGLQTWNSIRALDFLAGLPEVDPDRLGCTGASGGGTQTFILSAIDPRLKAAFPAVMVSTAMQGGCTCENACGLRIGSGNVEFAALFAPKPLGLTSANDWTREMASKGFPELRQLYELLGQPDHLSLTRGEQFGHNYNAVSRAAMYAWFNRHLKLGLPEPVEERDYQRLTRKEMSVWNASHPKPAGGPEFERRLLRRLADDSARRLESMKSSPAKYRDFVIAAWEVIVGRGLKDTGAVEWALKTKEDRGAHLEMTGLLRVPPHGEELPAVFLHPKEWKGDTVIWIHKDGKAGLFSADNAPLVAQLLKSGVTVAGVDLLNQGEFLVEGAPAPGNRRVNNPREAAAYTYGYNPSLAARRIQDVLTMVQFVTRYDQQSQSINLVGFDEAGAWVAAALPLCGDTIQRVVIDPGAFRFADVPGIYDANFLPGGAKYGDVPGLLELASVRELVVADGKGPSREAAVAALARPLTALKR